MAAQGGELAGPADLPVLGQPPAERADAARSRRKLLAAARAMIAEYGGVSCLSMDGLAARAGVGVGTVYRRFGDRGGLAAALLDDDEQTFQQAFIFGPPPLGPGAPPLERARAFLHGVLDQMERHADLAALVETRSPTARYNVSAYRVARMHLRQLLRAADLDIDPEYLVDALLAMAGPSLFIFQRRELGLSLQQIKAGVTQILERLDPGCPA
ncbi:MAG TPA: TetR/AcrR family transcriptional regulator [Pseudonocardia sp.]|jgi:AcrR family transcriptional regulator|nr:TetR/AcrR family transcriptional regulator [Pseudonocardia sp.]